MDEILITQEAAFPLVSPALYGTELTGLSVANVTTDTHASLTVNDFTNGVSNPPTGETWLHALFVSGGPGDDVQLSGAQWTDTHTTLTTSGGKVYEHYIPTGTVVGTAPTANLFIDNVLQVNHGTH